MRSHHNQVCTLALSHLQDVFRRRTICPLALRWAWDRGLSAPRRLPQVLAAPFPFGVVKHPLSPLFGAAWERRPGNILGQLLACRFAIVSGEPFRW